MILAQITDTHIKVPGALAYRKVDTAAHLRRAVQRMNAEDPLPDLVVFTGDLVDFGRAEEYAHLRRIIDELRAPYILLPGNHDERGELRAAFPDHAYLGRDGFVQYVIEDRPLRLVALDTLIPGQGGGTLCDERLAWLDRALAAAPQRPTVVMMHHPPFRTGIAGMDRQGLANADRFAAVIARHRQVERIICGHLHRSIQARVGGALASTCPAPCHQVALDLRPEAPLGFALEPPGYQLHVWFEGQGLVTHTVAIGDYGPKHPFRDGMGQLID